MFLGGHMLKIYCKKSYTWLKFSNKVIYHIENYVVPQYGDEDEDECSNYSAEDCIKQIKKYAARSGKNSRPGQDKIDLLKIAHYAQMAHNLIEEQEDAKE